MARAFTAASSHKLVKTLAVRTATPITMACWFKVNGVAAAYMLMTEGSSTDNNPNHLLRVRGDVAGDPLEVSSRNDAASATGTCQTGTVTAGTWFHAAGVWSATNSRVAYLNGSAGTTDTTSVTPVTVDRTSIGALERLSPTGYLDGVVAEAAIWSVALTTDEIVALAAGANPRRIRAHGLGAYWPLWGVASPEVDLGQQGNTYHMTVTGAVQADHAPVSPYLVAKRQFFYTVAAPAGGAGPAFNSSRAFNGGLTLNAKRAFAA